jgi:hypothetical protein
MEGNNNINIGHVTKRKTKSVVGSGFELGPSHARRAWERKELTATTAKPCDAVLYIQCELKPLPEKHF